MHRPSAALFRASSDLASGSMSTTRPDWQKGGKSLRSHRERRQPRTQDCPAPAGDAGPLAARRIRPTLAGVKFRATRTADLSRAVNSPLAPVSEAMARVLQLGDEDKRELRRLAQPAARRTKSPFRVERVRPHLRQLIESWFRTPAFVIGHAQDLLNVIAAFLPHLTDFAARGKPADLMREQRLSRCSRPGELGRQPVVGGGLTVPTGRLRQWTRRWGRGVRNPLAGCRDDVRCAPRGRRARDQG